MSTFFHRDRKNIFCWWKLMFLGSLESGRSLLSWASKIIKNEWLTTELWCLTWSEGISITPIFHFWFSHRCQFLALSLWRSAGRLPFGARSGVCPFTPGQALDNHHGSCTVLSRTSPEMIWVVLDARCWSHMSTINNHSCAKFWCFH